jgi:CHAT domain-containing protein
MRGEYAELPETAEEVEAIARLLQAPQASDPLQLRENASRSNVFAFNTGARLDDYRYLIFATHGVLPGEIDHIAQPALVLSHPARDGYLTMADVFQLQLNAKLVALSACNTGSGEQVRGEGVMGLTRAFMYAGTPAIAVTLWSVHSLSAKELDIGLFQSLKAGQPPAQALRSIKLRMLRGKDDTYRHPYYWAPFVIFGDGM